MWLSSVMMIGPGGFAGAAVAMPIWEAGAGCVGSVGRAGRSGCGDVVTSCRRKDVGGAGAQTSYGEVIGEVLLTSASSGLMSKSSVAARCRTCGGDIGAPVCACPACGAGVWAVGGGHGRVGESWKVSGSPLGAASSSRAGDVGLICGSKAASSCGVVVVAAAVPRSRGELECAEWKASSPSQSPSSGTGIPAP